MTPLSPFCPTCGIHLLSHESGDCLEEWLYGVVSGWKFYPTHRSMTAYGVMCGPDAWEDENRLFWFRRISKDDGMALRLMEKVWEMDRTAEIAQDKIYLLERRYMGHEECIEGATFPLRVCRAFIWLKIHGRYEWQR